VTSDRKRILKRGGDVVDVDDLTLQWKDFKSAASLDSAHFARGTRDPPSLLHWSPIRTCTLTRLNPLDFDALSSFYPLFSIPFDEVALHVTSPKLRLGGGVAIGRLDDSTLPTLVVISRPRSTNTIPPRLKTQELTSQAVALHLRSGGRV
jgi:hypothetical protein